MKGRNVSGQRKAMFAKQNKFGFFNKMYYAGKRKYAGLLPTTLMYTSARDKLTHSQPIYDWKQAQMKNLNRKYLEGLAVAKSKSEADKMLTNYNHSVAKLQERIKNEEMKRKKSNTEYYNRSRLRALGKI